MGQQNPGGQIQPKVITPSPPKSSKKSPTKTFIKIVIVLVLTVGLGVLGYIIFARSGIQKSEKPKLPIEITDTFSGQLLNQDNWFVFTSNDFPQLRQAEGEFTIQIPEDINEYTAAFIGTRAAVGGDFEASVDLNIVKSSLNSSSAFIFHDFTEGWLNSLIIYLENEADGNIVVRATTSKKGQEKILIYEKVPNLGYLTSSSVRLHERKYTLRIVRTGSNVKMTVGDSVIGEGADVYTGEGGFSLHVESRIPSSSAVISSFDNFNLHSL